MKDIILACIGFWKEVLATFERIFYRLIDITFFWIILFIIIMLNTRPTILAQIFTNLEQLTKSTEALIVGAMMVYGKMMSGRDKN